MSKLDGIIENVMIEAWAERFRRSPGQANALHESDSELVELPGDDERYLAVTVDTVHEEIAQGLYRDPGTMGWVCAVASLSDLAAVGATPLGLLVSVTLPDDADGALARGIADGVEQACREHGTYVLGGDTNTADSISLTGCAVGLVPRDGALERTGMFPGDSVFLSGRVGSGNALGMARMGGFPEDAFPEQSYRPTAELAFGELLRDHATACMDTSDGVCATLDQLMRLNGLGFNVDCDWSRLLAPEVLEFCDRTETPRWLMAAGPHGEFRLLFTVHASAIAGFMEAANHAGVAPVSLGTVQPKPAVTLSLTSGEAVDVDMARLRNLLQQTGGDMERYVSEFRRAGQEWGLE